jgi:APA family basic amino acid/polyamine antiporter
MLTAPRVYFAMANDGVFFRAVAKVHPVTQVPVVAIALQGAVAIVIAISGTYAQILGYVVATDFLFFALTGIALIRLRRLAGAGAFRAPGHPVTTVLFVTACSAVVLATVIATPVDSLIGLGILAAGLPAYWWWSRNRSAVQT